MNLSHKSSIASKLAMAVYFDSVKAKALAYRIGFYNTRIISHGKSNCLVAENDNQIWITFRGTDDKHDVAANIRFKKTHDEVHNGFKSRLRKINSQINSIIQTNLENKEIIFNGHSLGGAMALLAASEYKQCCQVFTFGAPRVGTIMFYNRSKHVTHYRFCNSGDIVPSVPPPFIGFKHTGKEFYFDHNNNVSTSNRLTKIYHTLMGIITKRVFIGRHRIRVYISNINRNKKEIDRADITRNS